MGVCYSLGKGVLQDYTQAVYWYRKAAEQGSATAQLCLGSCYYDGIGVLVDKPQAVYWWSKAAEQGNADAIELLKVYHE
ncbi:tetratricopeptide repeat protein [Barnesiella intestinihominis]|uniref:tetratricopeptide repeat protein n=1 Tax=Barnesiella intestinihominis TaxID=487174 RepID=UPI002674BB6F|nr:tetratricopeptide repeat protein [Barnesiella intestinihominis]